MTDERWDEICEDLGLPPKEIKIYAVSDPVRCLELIHTAYYAKCTQLQEMIGAQHVHARSKKTLGEIMDGFRKKVHSSMLDEFVLMSDATQTIDSLIGKKGLYEQLCNCSVAFGDACVLMKPYFLEKAGENAGKIELPSLKKEEKPKEKEKPRETTGMAKLLGIKNEVEDQDDTIGEKDIDG